jgi:hypothetical protein
MAVRLPRTLTKKRNALAYELGQLEVRITQVREGLRALDYSIKLLDPAWKPRKVHKPMISRGLRSGAIARACLSVLREMPGLATPVLADQVAEECGVTLDTAAAREDFASSVAMALRPYERKGLLEITGKHRTTGALSWRVRDEDKGHGRVEKGGAQFRPGQ